jgi:4-hydroxy-3-polyprenylbenzoate decarboxylase
VLERVDWTRDLHFHTRTTIDTLDYSGSGLNSGSKVVIAAAGDKKRELFSELVELQLPSGFSDAKVVMPGVVAIKANRFMSDESSASEMKMLDVLSGQHAMKGFPLIIVCDDSDFVARTLNNFLWVTFTRSNPSHDIHGVESFTEHKHWGCRGSLIIDARIKPHHAPPLIKDPAIEKRVDALGAKGGSLHGII